MRNFVIIPVAIFFMFPVVMVHAVNLAPEYITQSVPEAGIVGEGRMTYMMMGIYDARLYAPQGRFQSNQPLALSLTYLRDLRGIRIADRSIEEIRRQGFSDEIVMARWHTAMRHIFPDVSDGVTLTGVLTNDGKTVFYQNGIKIGQINDPEFGNHFFSIWLGSQTSESNLRDNLLRTADKEHIR